MNECCILAFLVQVSSLLPLKDIIANVRSSLCFGFSPRVVSAGTGGDNRPPNKETAMAAKVGAYILVKFLYDFNQGLNSKYTVF